MDNAQALEATLRTMTLGADAGALVTLARGLAQALDGQPSNASLAREYRAVVVALMAKANAADEVDDGTAEFWVSVRTPGRAVSTEES